MLLMNDKMKELCDKYRSRDIKAELAYGANYFSRGYTTKEVADFWACIM